MKWIAGLFACLVSLILAALLWNAYKQGCIIEWNQWVAKTYVAGQAGSHETVVRRMLGEPSSVRKPADVGQEGFSPVPPQVAQAAKVLLYDRVFLEAGGAWRTYVYIGKHGEVLRVHLAQS
jgi:hypothetical protein